MKLSDRIGQMMRRFELGEAAKAGEIMLFPRGIFKHPDYGTLSFDDEFFDAIEDNYQGKVLGQTEPFIDVDHNHGAAQGWIKELKRTGDGMFGKVEWTPAGQKAIENKDFRYISPWFGPYVDPATGDKHDRVLRGAALTNVPFLKIMPPVALFEPGVDSPARQRAQKGGVTVKLSELVCAEESLDALPNKIRAAFNARFRGPWNAGPVASAQPWPIEIDATSLISSVEEGDEGQVYYRVPWQMGADGHIAFDFENRRKVRQEWVGDELDEEFVGLSGIALAIAKTRGDRHRKVAQAIALYSPDQPRADDGKWADGGGGSADAKGRGATALQHVHGQKVRGGTSESGNTRVDRQAQSAGWRRADNPNPVTDRTTHYTHADHPGERLKVHSSGDLTHVSADGAETKSSDLPRRSHDNPVDDATFVPGRQRGKGWQPAGWRQN